MKTYDRWDIAGNRHLLERVWECAGAKRYFDAVETWVLVEFKNAWAEDMRADDKGEGVPIDKQKAAWQDCMERADAQIAAIEKKAA